MGTTGAEEALGAFAKVLDDLGGWLLLCYETYGLTRVDLGEVVVFGGDGLFELLARFGSLREQFTSLCRDQ